MMPGGWGLFLAKYSEPSFLLVPFTRDQPMDFLGFLLLRWQVSLLQSCLWRHSQDFRPMGKMGKGKNTLEAESEWTIQGEISRQNRILSLQMRELHLEVDDLFTVQKDHWVERSPKPVGAPPKMDRYSLTWETYHPKSWNCLPVIQENHDLVEYALRL